MTPQRGVPSWSQLARTWSTRTTGLAAAVLLTACGTLEEPVSTTSQASLTPASASTLDLHELPPPKNRIAAAVYGFRDETGQYKPQPASSFSTAVTQGAASLLIKSWRDSGG